jgi:adenosylhomocysteine nucleosidase
MSEKIIGIMGAMHEEIHSIIELMTAVEEFSYGMRTYYTGRINGIKAVVVFSRWGKVAAATTATSLIIKFKITDLIFGVAGAINPALKIGDIVIAEQLVQHDMDARPLIDRYEIPLLGVTYFKSDSSLSTLAEQAVLAIIDNYKQPFIGQNERNRFSLANPKLHKGNIASGDIFFANQNDRETLFSNLPARI